jgi:hypothetical protein
MYYLEGDNPDDESEQDKKILLDVIYSIHNIAVFKYYNIFTQLFIKPHNQTTTSNPTIQLVIDYLIENNSDELHKNKKEALFKTYFSNIGLERASEMATEEEARAAAEAARLKAAEEARAPVEGAMEVDERAQKAAEAETATATEAKRKREDHTLSPPRPQTARPRLETGPQTSFHGLKLMDVVQVEVEGGAGGGKKTKKLKIYKTKTNNIKVSNKTKNKKNKKKIILNKTLKTNIRNNSNKKKNLKKRLKKANQNKKNKNIKRIKNYNKSLKKTKKNKKYIYNISIKRK